MNSYILAGQLDIIRVMEIYRAVSTFQRYKWTIFRLISHSFSRYEHCNKLCNKKRERENDLSGKQSGSISLRYYCSPAILWTGYIDIISTLGSPLPPEPLLPFWKELPRPALILYPICYAPRAWRNWEQPLARSLMPLRARQHTRIVPFSNLKFNNNSSSSISSKSRRFLLYFSNVKKKKKKETNPRIHHVLLIINTPHYPPISSNSPSSHIAPLLRKEI